MITLQHLSSHLDQLLGCHQFLDAPNGIQIEGKEKISKIGFAVSANIRAIEEATKRGCDALLVHHGIFWPKDTQVIQGVRRKKIALLIGSDISLLAYHLPLDAHPVLGNNWKAAKEMGWENLEPFGVYGKTEIGVKGTFAPKSTAEFQKHLEVYYGRPAHLSLCGKKTVTSAALVSGGAHKMIEEAADAGVDCFITGSFDEPIFDLALERNIHFFALGHYATERIGVLALKAYLEEEYRIRGEWIETPNPF